MAGERTLASLSRYRKRYKKADRQGRSKVLTEFCETMEYHRKYAIALLGRPVDEAAAEGSRKRRGARYGPAVSRALEHVWACAGYPWSVRLKAMLPQWLPWARRHLRGLTPDVEQALLKIRLIRFYRTCKLNGVDMLTYPEFLDGLWMEVIACPRACYTMGLEFEAMNT